MKKSAPPAKVPAPPRPAVKNADRIADRIVARITKPKPAK